MNKWGKHGLDLSVRTGKSGRFLWRPQWTFRFSQLWGLSWLIEEWSASQEGSFHLEIVSWFRWGYYSCCQNGWILTVALLPLRAMSTNRYSVDCCWPNCKKSKYVRVCVRACVRLCVCVCVCVWDWTLALDWVCKYKVLKTAWQIYVSTTFPNRNAEAEVLFRP